MGSSDPNDSSDSSTSSSSSPTTSQAEVQVHETPDERAKRVAARNKKKAEEKAKKAEEEKRKQQEAADKAEAEDLRKKDIDELFAKIKALDPTNQEAGAALVRAGLVDPSKMVRLG